MLKNPYRKMFCMGATLLLTLAVSAPTLAVPWPMYRDAGGDGLNDGRPPQPTAHNYKEYDYDHAWPKWADTEIKEAVSWDLMKGYPDGKDWVGRQMYRFHADKEVTRIEFVTILNRALGYDEDAKAAKAAFPGEAVPDWAVGHLGMLVKKGVVDKGGKFDGARPATRREIAVWLGRAVKAESLPLTVPEPSFPDFKPGDPGYEDALYAVRAGLMRGYEDNTFRPDATFTRAQSAAVIVRLAKSLPPGDWTMTADEFIRWFEMFTIAGKARWPANPPDEVYLPWMTPEFLDGMRAQMRNFTGVNTGKDWAVPQRRWNPYADTNGAAALRVPGSPKAVARVATRTVMAYDIGYIPIGPIGSADSLCWRADYPSVLRVYLRRYPYGLRISDTQSLPSQLHAKMAKIAPGGIEEWWSNPSWYEGHWAGLYERLPDGTFKPAGPYDGPGTGACAGAQLPKP